jgi:hypothetical protein
MEKKKGKRIIYISLGFNRNKSERPEKSNYEKSRKKNSMTFKGQNPRNSIRTHKSPKT